jgi:hypothetical protein
MILDRRLIGADLLKLATRPRTLVPSVLIPMAIVAVMYVSARDMEFADVMLLATTWTVVGASIGALAGSQDSEAGVLRDLFATGRDRMAFYVSRIAAAWIVSVLIILPALALTVGLWEVVDHGSRVRPVHTHEMVAGVIMGVVATMLGAAGAVGLSGLIRSRGAVTSIVTVTVLALSPLLESAKSLGDARQLLPGAALTRIGDIPHRELSLSLATAIVVLAGWMLAPILLGAWRERRREI